MNSSETKTLWISLGAGLLAAFLLYSYSQEKKAEYDQANGAMKNVVVTAGDIRDMATIDDTMLEVVQKPSRFIEPGAVSDPESIVGQVAARPMKKGEQVVATNLVQQGPDTGIALQVAPSKRAISLSIDESRGVAKLIRPGDRVDIYAAMDAGKGLTQHKEVSLLMEDVVVLATGMRLVNNLPRTFELDAGGKSFSMINLASDSTYSTLTIEASPKEAQDLVYILSTSPQNLYFTLRNPNDRKLQPRLPASTAETVMGRVGMEASAAAFVAPPVPQQGRAVPRK